MSPSLLRDSWPKRLVLWAALTAIFFIFFWFEFELVLLAFSGLLLAIILHTGADWVQAHTPRKFGFGLSYTTTVLGILVLACLLCYLVVPHAIAQAGEISRIVPQSIQQIKDNLQQTEWGRYIVQAAQRSVNGSGSGIRVSTLTGDLAGAVEGGVVVLVVGFYGALNASEDSEGLLRLVPGDKRQRVKEVIGKIVYTLRWWLLGQMVPMTVLGAATMIGLWLMGVPLAFALGLLTGLMIFIPYVGSWIAYIPTVLVALTQGPHTALYVTLFYLAIHGIEGYVLTPLVQKRAVLLPPVLTILAQLLLWNWVGLLGVAVATPLAAAGLSLVKILYLHENIEH